MPRPAVNLRFDREAFDILNRLAPTPKSKGEFLARLLFEYEVALTERKKFREQSLLEEELTSLTQENTF